MGNFQQWHVESHLGPFDRHQRRQKNQQQHLDEGLKNLINIKHILLNSTAVLGVVVESKLDILVEQAILKQAGKQASKTKNNI